MHELLKEAEAAAARNHTTLPEVTMRFTSNAAREPRRYNRPTVEEVAAIFVGSDGAPPSHKDIVVYPRGQESIECPNFTPASTRCLTSCYSLGELHKDGVRISSIIPKSVHRQPNALA